MPSTFAVDELNFCVRNGNRWILVAIVTGMAPLVGLEATEKFQKCLILVRFCPILLHFQRKIKSCAKRVPKHITSDSDLKNTIMNIQPREVLQNLPRLIFIVYSSSFFSSVLASNLSKSLSNNLS